MNRWLLTGLLVGGGLGVGCAHSDAEAKSSDSVESGSSAQASNGSTTASPDHAAAPAGLDPSADKTTANTGVMVSKAHTKPTGSNLDSAALLARGKADVALFYGSDKAAFFAQMSPAVQGQITAEQVSSANDQVKAQFGPEKSLISEDLTTTAGLPTYRRVFTSTNVPGTFDLDIVFDANGLMMGCHIVPHVSSP